MSDMGHRAADPLPEDIGARVAAAQEKISRLERQLVDLGTEATTKSAELERINADTVVAREALATLESAQAAKIAELAERERRVASKESALDAYASGLKEKEAKLQKYLAVFEGMKSVIGS